MNEAPWAVSILLGKRKPKARNVLLGSDRVVIKALEKKYQIKIKRYDLEDPQVFSVVDQESQVPLAEHAECAFWRNPPITRNKELLTYIITTMTPDLKEADRLPIINNFIYDVESIRDFDVLYWRIKAAIGNKIVGKWDKQPWETQKGWLGSTDPDTRLARLYFDLRAFIYVKIDGKSEIKTLGLTVGKIKYLNGLNLSNKPVVDTLGILARWRNQTISGIEAAFLVSTTWSP
jgi:hypothetical protein